MKFKCARKNFADILRIIYKAVPSKNDTPILSGIYIEANDEGLILQSTDNKIGFICRVNADVEEPGKIVIAAKYFQEIINKLPGTDFEFSYDQENNIAHVKADQSNYTFLSMNPNDFPVIKPITDETSFVISNKQLMNLVRKTSFACATDENRPLLTGCNLDIDGNTLTMAATNTHRLAIKREQITEQNQKIKITIPARVLNDITQIAGSENAFDIKINCTESKVSFSFGDIYMFSGIIKGDYPEYQKAVPTEFAIKVKLNTAAFREAIERVSLISRTNQYNIVKMTFADDQVKIYSQNPEIGKAEETVAANIEGEALNIAFNAQYMLDLLKIIDSDEITMSMNTNIKPVSIKGTDDEDFTYISTPVRTSN